MELTANNAREANLTLFPMNQSCSLEIRETDIAIINLACRFPGANNPEQFWQNLREGIDSIKFFDDGELE